MREITALLAVLVAYESLSEDVGDANHYVCNEQVKVKRLWSTAVSYHIGRLH